MARVIEWQLDWSSLEVAVLVRQLHFRGDEGKRLGVIELHCSFQTKSWYHYAQAAALHHARDVAAFYTPRSHVTFSGCRGDVQERLTFCPRKSGEHICKYA